MATIQHRTTLIKTFYQFFCQLTGKHERPFFFLAVLINIHRYTETFANRLAETLHSLCDSTTKIVFMCCPTAFVAFQHRKRLDNAMLLEYDQRFAVLSPKQFIPYDLDEPDIFPKSLKGSVDLAVVDPPFLNEVNHTSFSLINLLIFSYQGHQSQGRSNAPSNSPPNQGKARSNDLHFRRGYTLQAI